MNDEIITNDGISVRGDLQIIHKDKNNVIISKENHRNVVVDNGLLYIARSILNLENTSNLHVFIGTGGVVDDNRVEARPSDTALHTFYDDILATTEIIQINESGVLGTPTYVPFRVILRITCSLLITSYVKLSEAGIFTSSFNNSPTMITHKTFSEREYNELDTMEIQWDLSLGRFMK